MDLTPSRPASPLRRSPCATCAALRSSFPLEPCYRVSLGKTCGFFRLCRKFRPPAPLPTPAFMSLVRFRSPATSAACGLARPRRSALLLRAPTPPPTPPPPPRKKKGVHPNDNGRQHRPEVASRYTWEVRYWNSTHRAASRPVRHTCAPRQFPSGQLQGRGLVHVYWRTIATPPNNCRPKIWTGPRCFGRCSAPALPMLPEATALQLPDTHRGALVSGQA